MRINKYLAWKKLCTRREADTLIEKGLVILNGTRAPLGAKVEKDDIVEVRFRKKQYHYYAYNKPRGVITHSPAEDEKDVAQSIPLTGVFPVGRLDKDSHGLMILTDDGRITDMLLHPSYEHEKEYLVAVKEKLASNFKTRMERGVDIEGYLTKPAKVTVLDDKRFLIVITEGKKHQIRRMCAAFGYTTADLKRTRIMNIMLGNLTYNEYREIKGKELAEFLTALGMV